MSVLSYATPKHLTPRPLVPRHMSESYRQVKVRMEA
jgi:hypothetical protein